MPDDIEVTEQEEDALAAFDEEAGIDDGDPDKETPETPDDSGDGDDGEGDGDAEDGKGGEEDGSDEGEPEKDETGKPDGEPDEGDEGDEDDPEKRLEKILEARESDAKPKVDTKPDARPDTDPEKPGGEPEKPAPISLSIEQANGLNNFITIDQLPDANIPIGKNADGNDMKLNLREFAAEEPETFAMVKAVAGLMNGAMIRQLVDAGILMTNKSGQAVVQPVNETIQELRDTIDDINFEREVGYLGHPDYTKINRSKEFADWLETQPARVVNMAKALRTPEEAATILDLYKKSTADASVKNFDDKARKKKAAKDALHRDTSRKSVKERPETKNEEDIDEQAAFEEEAAALDKRDKR